MDRENDRMDIKTIIIYRENDRMDRENNRIY